jgi:uncharacterized DUF497 family protein
MIFEWNELKSAANFAKHGISFEEAVMIWTGMTVEISEIARSDNDESRGATLGVIGESVYTAIWTMRSDKIRLISVRRARNGEAKAYFEKIQQENSGENL